MTVEKKQMAQRQACCYLAAVLLHAVMLFGITIPVVRASARAPERRYLEVALVAEPPPELAPAPEPPLPQIPPLPEPPSTEPAQPPEPPPEPPVEPVPPAPEPPPPIVETASIAVPTPPPPAIAPTATPPPTPQPPAPSVMPPPPGTYVAIAAASFANRVEPDYPAQSRRLRQEGTVVLALYLNAAGTLDKVEIVKSSGYRMLDDAAVAAMKRSQFRPALQGAIPVPARAEITITFQLH